VLKTLVYSEEGLPLYQSSGKVKFNGDIHFRDSLPRLLSSEQIEPLFSVNFSGYAGFGRVIDSQLFYESNIRYIEFNTAQSQIRLRPMNLKIETQTDFTSLLIGGFHTNKLELELQSIDIKGANHVSLSDVKLKSAMDLQKGTGLANIVQQYSLGTLGVDDFAMQDFFFDLRVENYSQAFHLDYLQFVNQIDLDNLNKATYDQFLSQSLPRLLKKAPHFDLKSLSFNLPNKGELYAQAQATFDEVEDLPRGLTTLPFWEDKAFVRASLSVDQAVIDELAYLWRAKDISESTLKAQGRQMSQNELKLAVDSQVQFVIAALTGMAIISPTDKGYEFKAEYDRGKTIINGEDFSAPFGGF